jgi:hypothetical protein
VAVDAYLPLAIGTAQTMLIVIVRYFAASGGFAWWTARRGITAGPADPERRRRQVRAEIRWSLVSAVIYGLPAGLMLAGWRFYGLTAITTAGVPKRAIFKGLVISKSQERLLAVTAFHYRLPQGNFLPRGSPLPVHPCGRAQPGTLSPALPFRQG